MPDQNSAASEHSIMQEITQPLAELPRDPVAQVANVEFPLVLRGYEREAVDEYIRETTQLVAELHATRSPEGAVRRALERVGEQVSDILARAHETAEQITNQSRGEAEERLMRARSESEILERDARELASRLEAEARQRAETRERNAEARVRELDAEVERIWSERDRIVADVRKLSEDLADLGAAAQTRFPAATTEDTPLPFAPVKQAGPAGSGPEPVAELFESEPIASPEQTVPFSPADEFASENGEAAFGPESAAELGSREQFEDDEEFEGAFDDEEEFETDDFEAEAYETEHTSPPPAAGFEPYEAADAEDHVSGFSGDTGEEEIPVLPEEEESGFAGPTGLSPSGGSAADLRDFEQPTSVLQRPQVRLIDLRHLGRDRVIGCWQVDDVLIDPGPASCLDTLLSALGDEQPRALLLTHIHLDHAGATGSLVERWPELEVYVHEIGAAHLVDPTRLLESAARLYGADMERLWGEFLPVPEANLRILSGGEQLLGRQFEVAYTPGHASHHVCYLFDTTAFVGDAGGVRITPEMLTIPPTPPPDIDLEAWHGSIERIFSWQPERLAMTHFGSSDDVESQLSRARRAARHVCGRGPCGGHRDLCQHRRERDRARSRPDPPRRLHPSGAARAALRRARALLEQAGGRPVHSRGIDARRQIGPRQALDLNPEPRVILRCDGADG